jgi:hypothetical protein
VQITFISRQQEAEKWDMGAAQPTKIKAKDAKKQQSFHR